MDYSHAERIKDITAKLLTRRAASHHEARQARSYRKNASHGEYQKAYSKAQRQSLTDLKKNNPEAYARLLAEVVAERNN